MTTIATPAQLLVTGNCSNPLQLLTCSCSLNTTITAATDSDHIFDDQNKPTTQFLLKIMSMGTVMMAQDS
ncbi:unnamed protein product [Brassica rapa subsp. narinosa]